MTYWFNLKSTVITTRPGATKPRNFTIHRGLINFLHGQISNKMEKQDRELNSTLTHMFAKKGQDLFSIKVPAVHQ